MAGCVVIVYAECVHACVYVCFTAAAAAASAKSGNNGTQIRSEMWQRCLIYSILSKHIML